MSEYIALNGLIYAAEYGEGVINDIRYQVADWRGGASFDTTMEFAEWYGQHLTRQAAELTMLDFPFIVNEVAFIPATLGQLLGIDAIDKPAMRPVSAIVLGATESTLTITPDATDIFEDNEPVIVSDGAGYKKQGFIDGIPPSTTSAQVDDGFGAVVSGIDLVGVHAHINGTTQCFTGADDVLFDIGSGQDYSIIIRFQRDSKDRMEVLMSKTTNANGTAYGTTAGWCLFFDVNNRLHFAVNDGVDAYIINGISRITDKLYHAIMVTFDEDTEGGCLIYLDGYDDTADYTGTLANIGDCSNVAAFAVGGEADAGLPFDGYVQDVAIYANIVLTAANALTYATVPQTELGSPDAWYPFKDTAAATTIGDEATTTPLVSFDLTLVGGTTTNFGTHSRSQDAVISANLIPDGDMELGGIGAWAAGDAASIIAKVSDSKYHKYGSQALRIVNNDASQAFARMTVATVMDTDYHFVGWFRSPGTPNGASTLVDIDVLPIGALVSQYCIAGNTWYKIEFDFEAGDTSTTIDLGSGSVTSGDVGYWDGCQIFKNYLDEPGFEDTIINSSWDTTGAPTVDDADTTTERSGTSCYKVNGSSSAYVSQDITLTLGEDYLFIGHVKCGTADAGKIVLSDAVSITLDNENNTTTYEEVRYQFTAATTTLTIKIYGNAQDAYYDDFAVIKAEVSEYILDANFAPPTLEWLFQFTAQDGLRHQVYFPQCFVQGFPINFSNKDYVTETITILPIDEFIYLMENP